MKKLILFFIAATLAVPVLAQTRETRTVNSFTRISFRHSGKIYVKQGSPQKVELQGDKDILEKIETDVDGSRLVIGRKDTRWFGDWNDHDDITVYITVPKIEGLSVSGSGDLMSEGKITGDDMNLNVSGSGSVVVELDLTGELEADVSGSGNIEVKGSCKSFESDVSGSGKVQLAANIREDADFGVSGSGRIIAKGSAASVNTAISGSGKVLAADLETRSCKVKISGSGDVEINVQDDLDAVISGSGSVSYRGNPARVNSHASGSGTVRKL